MGRLALGELLKRYEHVIRRLVERRGPVYGMTADDMHQEFLLHLATPLKNGNSRLSGLDPVNGRFRYWLSKTVANRVSNLRRQAIAQRLDRTHSFGSDVPECCDVVGQEVFPLPSDLEDDLALAEDPRLAEAADLAHFSDQLGPGAAGEVMSFDYRMRPGLATTTNALRLMELVGLPTDAA